MDTTKEQAVNNFGFWFWIHLSFICIAYLAWVLFDWRIVIIGTALVFLQWLVFKRCIISSREINAQNWEDNWFYHYSQKLGLRADKRHLHIFSTYVSPGAIVFAAIIWQVVLHHSSYF